MKKTNLFIMFKEDKAPFNLISEVKYRIKKYDDKFYTITGDIDISREFEGTDYIVKDMQREGGKVY
jgi:hypothetical protein